MSRVCCRILAVLALGIVVIVAGCGKKEASSELAMQTLERDTVWQGTVVVNGDIYVPEGVTLTVLPGTTVKFKRIDEKSDQNMFGVESPYYPEAELIIRGRIMARGTAKDAIVFTSAEIDARPSDWGAINLLGSDHNLIERCKILFAYNGVHGHGATAVIRENEFAKNGVGISFKMEEEARDAAWFGKPSAMEITHNRIYQNKGGIGFRNSNGTIAHNLIEDNKFFGIFAKEKNAVTISFNQITGNKKGVYLYQAQGLTLANNNIFANTDYNIAVAEAQDFDMDAANNWFGSINEEKIAESIFDRSDDPDLGKINFQPFLKKKIAWE